MAKYYVESGTLRTIISADDPQKAALLAVHQAIGQALPLDAADATPEEKQAQMEFRGLQVLGDEIRLNERGFDRTDGLRLDTYDVVVHWSQLLAALAKLERTLGSE
jgi:hypothetical protein